MLSKLQPRFLGDNESISSNNNKIHKYLHLLLE